MAVDLAHLRQFKGRSTLQDAVDLKIAEEFMTKRDEIVKFLFEYTRERRNEAERQIVHNLAGEFNDRVMGYCAEGLIAQNVLGFKTFDLFPEMSGGICGLKQLGMTRKVMVGRQPLIVEYRYDMPFPLIDLRHSSSITCAKAIHAIHNPDQLRPAWQKEKGRWYITKRSKAKAAALLYMLENQVGRIGLNDLNDLGVPYYVIAEFIHRIEV